MHPDRIVIGSTSSLAGDHVAEVYSSFSAPIIRTGLAAVEMIKYTSNAFLATKISFSNEIGNICKELGIDVYEVMNGVGLDQRIGPQFLNAGAGFGGSCFPKDVSSLAILAGRAGIEPRILNAVLEVNESQPHRLIALLEKKAGTLSGKRITVLWLAKKVIEITGSSSAISFHPLTQDDPHRRMPDVTRAKQVLGWEPKVPREKGLVRTIE